MRHQTGASTIAGTPYRIRPISILPSGVDRAAGYPQNELGGAKPAPLFLGTSGLRCLEAHT